MLLCVESSSGVLNEEECGRHHDVLENFCVILIVFWCV